jgi:pimeloyl-ACP methyl ester carboxylesterase
MPSKLHERTYNGSLLEGQSRMKRRHLLSILLAVTFAVHAARAQQLQAGREQIPGAEVLTGSIKSAEGYPLTVFLTRPKGSTGKLPVIFEVAWLSCDSVEQPKGPEDGFTQLLWDLAGKSGFATFRVDKPGVGQSGGPKCSDLDFATELAAYRTAFATIKNYAFMDPSRIYLLGFSNGGGFAPLVAADMPVRGYLVFSGWYKTWFEHMIEHERRRLCLSGVSQPEISRRMRQYATFYDLYLNQKMTPGEVIAQHPEFKPIWYDEQGHQYGRPASFYHQLEELNLAEAWEKVTVPVLAVHGGYDWVMSGDDYQLLVNALNARHAGSAEFIEWPHGDHGLYTHTSEQNAFHRDPEQKYDPKLTETVLEWLTRVETSSTLR